MACPNFRCSASFGCDSGRDYVQHALTCKPLFYCKKCKLEYRSPTYHSKKCKGKPEASPLLTVKQELVKSSLQPVSTFTSRVKELQKNKSNNIKRDENSRASMIDFSSELCWSDNPKSPEKLFTPVDMKISRRLRKPNLTNRHEEIKFTNTLKGIKTEKSVKKIGHGIRKNRNSSIVKKIKATATVDFSSMSDKTASPDKSFPDVMDKSPATFPSPTRGVYGAKSFLKSAIKKNRKIRNTSIIKRRKEAEIVDFSSMSDNTASPDESFPVVMDTPPATFPVSPQSVCAAKPFLQSAIEKNVHKSLTLPFSYDRNEDTPKSIEVRIVVHQFNV